MAARRTITVWFDNHSSKTANMAAFRRAMKVAEGRARNSRGTRRKAHVEVVPMSRPTIIYDIICGVRNCRHEDCR